MVMIGKKLVPQIRINSHYSNNIDKCNKNVEADWQMIDKHLVMIIT